MRPGLGVVHPQDGGSMSILAVRTHKFAFSPNMPGHRFLGGFPQRKKKVAKPAPTAKPEPMKAEQEKEP